MTADAPARLPMRAIARLLTALGAGVVAALLAHLWVTTMLAVVIGMVALHATFLTLGWLALWNLDAEATKVNARREDFNPRVEELLVLVFAAGALTGIGILVATGASSEKVVAAPAAFFGVFLASASVHLMYAARYAYLYYDGDEGAAAKAHGDGIDWNCDGYQPTYRDFLYFSYNLGMTYQVSDTSVSDPKIRWVTLRQCMIAFLLGAVVLGATINLVSGLATSGS